MLVWGCQPKEEAKPADAQKAAEAAKPAPAPEVKKEEPKPAEEPKKEEPKPAEEPKKEEPKPAEAKPAETAPAGALGEANPTGKKIALQFYVMSQCPFGTQVMDGAFPMLKKMGNWVDFRMDFIGQVSGETLTSMHGDNEVKGDIIELCLQKYMENYGYIDTVACMNKAMREIPNNFEKCAGEAGVAAEKLAEVKKCIDGDEGKTLLKESFNKAQQAGASGSPTIFLNNKPYRGGRGEKDFMRGLCAEFTDAKPEECGKIPPPVKVEGIVLKDKRCTDRNCDTSRLEGSFTSMFPGLTLKVLDYADEEGKKLYEAEGIQYLPVILFDTNIEKAEGSDRLARFLKPSKSGTFKVFQGRANFDPKAEICDNKIDDTGDGVIDCDDATCKNTLACRPEVPGQLEVFVMSQCPFGVKALNAMKEVLEAFGADVKFQIHYIGDEQNGAPTSMHGQGEVDENIRELCVIKNYPENNKYMEYILCRNQNIRDANWQACAVNGIEAAKIEACFNGEGKQMLLDDYKVAKGLGIGASPTWIANGKFQFSGVDAATIGRNICQHNSAFAGCSKTLSGDTGGAPTGGCGQ
jgi:predicted DsbA family dithiol-disulfide isomerase